MNKLLLFVFIALLAGCGSLRISYDYDKQANFANYKTYAFTEDAMKLPLDELNRNRIIAAVEKEMAGKGFSKADSPDVLIDLLLKTAQKVEATATNSGGYGYGRYGYGGGFSTTQINYNEYIEGTLFVNMVDKSTEKIVWQGRGTNTIDPDANATKREQNINYAVLRIFTNYPPKK